MRGFKNFHAAERTLAGIEIMAMLRKGQTKTPAGAVEYLQKDRFLTIGGKP